MPTYLQTSTRQPACAELPAHYIRPSGHGESDDAIDPIETYTRPGLADAAIELLRRIGVAQAAVFGWSFGGHIGIEMMTRFPDCWD